MLLEPNSADVCPACGVSHGCGDRDRRVKTLLDAEIGISYMDLHIDLRGSELEENHCDE